jgi:hypothetical protein
MTNCSAVNYDDIPAHSNLLHRTPIFLVVLCNWILENKSFQFFTANYARYNITDKYLFTYISVVISFRGLLYFIVTHFIVMYNSLNIQGYFHTRKSHAVMNQYTVYIQSNYINIFLNFLMNAKSLIRRWTIKSPIIVYTKSLQFINWGKWPSTLCEELKTAWRFASLVWIT